MLTESKKHKGLLQHLTVVLNWFTWLAKHHKKWRNPIIVNAFLASLFTRTSTLSHTNDPGLWTLICD
jgi:hypothetical protein